MPKLSILSKFKPEVFYLELDESWIQYSLDTEEIQLLEPLLVEKDGQVCLPLLKRYGIHPSENESIKEAHEKSLQLGKQFFELVDQISQKTGLTRVEVLVRIPEDLSRFSWDLEEESKDGKDKDLREAIIEIKAKIKKQSVEINSQLEPYLDQLRPLNIEYETATGEYYLALALLFLNESRVIDTDKIKTKPARDSLLTSTFTRQNLENLHRGFLTALVEFAKSESGGGSKSLGN